MKNTVIVGQSGNLARSLAKYFPNAFRIGRDQYLAWLQNPQRLKTYFNSLGISPDNTNVFNCVGVINPDGAKEDIESLNYDLPVLLSEESVNLKFRLFTFGTVMETLPNYATSNNYLDSKLRFYNKFINSESWMNSNTHIQMHTLYGGKRIHPHMFLGQIRQAISHNEVFKMSGGEQIREYHHIDDDAQAIKLLSMLNISGVKNISHSQPKKLKDVAISIFNHFDRAPLLKLSESQTDLNDNLGVIFEKSEELSHIHFRDSIENIILWLEEGGRDNE